MLSKRLKSHSRANIRRGLGKRLDLRAKPLQPPPPDFSGRASEPGGHTRPDGAAAGAWRRRLARIALTLALFLLPLCGWAAWKLSAEYETESCRAREEAALLHGEAGETGVSLPEAAARKVPPGLFAWLKERSDEVMHRLGLAAYAPEWASVAPGSAGKLPGSTAMDNPADSGKAAQATITPASPDSTAAGRLPQSDGSDGPETPRTQDAALAKALRDFFPTLDSRAYYMLWRDGRVVCAPLAPEAEGVDLSNLRGAAGHRFVEDFTRKAAERGGYLLFSIPAGRTGDEYPARVSGQLGGERGRGASESVRPAVDGAREVTEFLAYVAPFEDSDIYLTVWRPLPGKPFAEKNKFFPRYYPD